MSRRSINATPLSLQFEHKDKNEAAFSQDHHGDAKSSSFLPNVSPLSTVISSPSSSSFTSSFSSYSLTPRSHRQQHQHHQHHHHHHHHHHHPPPPPPPPPLPLPLSHDLDTKYNSHYRNAHNEIMKLPVDIHEQHNNKWKQVALSYRSTLSRLLGVEQHCAQLLIELSVARRNLHTHSDVEFDALAQAHSELQQQCANVTAERDDVTTKLREMEQRVADLTATNEQLSSQVSSLTSARDSLSASLVRLNGQLSLLSSENSKLLSHSKTTADQLTQCNQQLATVTQLKEEAEKRSNAAEKEAANRREEGENKERENRRLQGQMKEMQDKTVNMQTQINTMNQTIQNLTQSSSLLSSSLASHRSNGMQLSSLLHDSDAALSTLRRMYETREQTVAAKQTEMENALREMKAEWEREVEERKREHAECERAKAMEREIREAHALCEERLLRFESSNSSLTSSLSALQSSYNDTLSSHNAAVLSLQHQVTQLTLELNQATTAVMAARAINVRMQHEVNVRREREEQEEREREKEKEKEKERGKERERNKEKEGQEQEQTAQGIDKG